MTRAIANKDKKINFKLLVVNTIIAKIRPQFPDNEYGEIALKTVRMAIEDVAYQPSSGYRTQRDRVWAIDFLAGEMEIVEMAGVSSQWVREVIYKVGEFFYGRADDKRQAGPCRLLAESLGVDRKDWLTLSGVAEAITRAAESSRNRHERA